jgi:hypothetical protein
MNHLYDTTVANVLKEYPTLTANGFGGSGNIDPEAVKQCIDWLAHHNDLERRKTINTKMSSYGWKHLVERHVGNYISNGDFICAALHMKHKIKITGLNAYFNINTFTEED